MSLKQGTLVKYATAPHLSLAGGHCYWNLNWSFAKIESNLIGIVLEPRGNKRVKVRWFGINETFVEYEKYLEVVK